MKKSFIALILMLLTALITCSRKTELTLVQSGRSEYVLVLAENASPSEQHAARDFQKHLQQISGATLPIISAVNAPALANLVRGAILFFTAALALRQAGLPGDIVGIAFGSVVGAIAVGVAVAVGVGGRHVAGRLLEEAVQALRTEPPPSDAPPIRFPD